MCVCDSVYPMCQYNVSVRACSCVPMSQRRDEVEAAVDAVVNNVSAVKATFIMQVTLKLVINVGNNGTETARKHKALGHPID